MNTELIVTIIVLVILYMIWNNRQNEGFYFRTPPLAYDSDACDRMCQNTSGCNHYYYDPVTRQCFMSAFYKYGDLYYPYMHNGNHFFPLRYRHGRYWGTRFGENYKKFNSKYLLNKRTQYKNRKS